MKTLNDLLTTTGKMFSLVWVVYILTGKPVVAQAQERPVDPRAEASLAQGITYFQQGNFNAAIAAFNQSIVIAPDYPLAFNNRGLVQTATGNYAAAIKDFDQAIQLNPSYVFAFNNRGKAHSRLGNYQEALQDFS